MFLLSTFLLNFKSQFTKFIGIADNEMFLLLIDGFYCNMLLAYKMYEILLVNRHV